VLRPVTACGSRLLLRVAQLIKQVDTPLGEHNTKFGGGVSPVSLSLLSHSITSSAPGSGVSGTPSPGARAALSQLELGPAAKLQPEPGLRIA
jgi:hypothetical protein